MNRLDHFTLYRLSLVAIFTLTLFACGGGGCSGCESCGITPIPGGYPAAERIDNSAQMRLSSSGITFVEDNIGGIVSTLLPDGLDFPIPRSSTDVAIIGAVTICPADNCAAHLEIESLELSPTDPNVLVAHVRLILDSRNSAGGRAPLPLDLGVTCLVDLDTRRGSRTYIGLRAEIRFASITEPARAGYTEVTFEDASGASTVVLATGEEIETADIDVSNESCSGLGCLDPRRLLCTAADLDFVKNLLIDQVADQISGIAEGLSDSFCTSRGEYGCPTGTFAVPDENPDSTCRYAASPTADCVPTLLGTDGQGDLGGSLIGGASPGTHAYVQLLLAAGGDGEAVNEGMSLSFYGGFMGTDSTFTETPAHNSCVPMIDPPALPVIPRIDAFRGNVIPGTSDEAHVGFGIAEAYLDHVGYGLFDSGMLCIGAGTRLSQQLSTGLLSAAIMSIPELTYPLGDAPITIALRPQQPMDFTLGTGAADDALIQIALPELQVDFYVWSTERYVRFMTFQTDMDIGINLTAEANQIVPMITGVEATNSVVTNSDLLEERPEALAATLETLIGSFAGMLTSGLSPFDLPDVMGFNLEVPPNGITRVSEMGHDFLGIFANLSLATMPLTYPVETSLTTSDLRLAEASMHPEHWGEERNTVWLHFGGAAGPLAVDYEYSYRIDGGPWSAWTTEQRVEIDDEILLLQARHEIEARGRVVGAPASVDETPAIAELIVDILPPNVHVIRTVEGIEIEASDVITDASQLEYRYRIGELWTAWGSVASMELPTDAEDVSVEVRDESGNVGGAQAALIRGLPNPAGSDGCGCRVASDDDGAPLGFLVFLGVLGAIFVRRRRRGSPRSGRASLGAVFGALGLGLVALVASGCNCGGEQIPCGGRCTAATPPSVTTGSICCGSTDMCAMYDVDGLCDPGYTCPVDNLDLDDASCDVTCSACVPKPALEPGILATHLDMVVDDSGGVFLSGYNPGVGPDGPAAYGDLVFGVFDGTDVTWEIVDGAPTTPITNDPDGWRGGVSDPHDDVGRWTSLVDQGGTYLISYYDTSHGALKFAAGGPGAWQTHAIDESGDSGRYSSMVLLPDGTPAIAYLQMIESTDSPGTILGNVMVAMASGANPTAMTDWTITQVASAVMPCRPDLCTGLQACLEVGTCVTPTGDCPESCAADQTCFNGRCEASLPSGYVEDLPPAHGLYTSLATTPTGLALVWYDRTQGNVLGASFDGTTWGAPITIDGYAMGDPLVGDCGQGADLTVDAGGTWHVVYIDGAEETLRYAQVAADGTVALREVVSDGSTSDGSTRFTDGRHIIGDDASIVVDPGGTARVVYQDATIQDAVVSVRPAGGGAWATLHFDGAGAGYWLEQELLGTTSYTVTFWRLRDGRMMNSGVRVTTLD